MDKSLRGPLGWMVWREEARGDDLGGIGAVGG